MLVARIGALVIEWVNAVGTASVDNFIVEFSIDYPYLSRDLSCRGILKILLINRNTR